MAEHREPVWADEGRPHDDAASIGSERAPGSRHRWIFVAGLILCLLAPAAYVLQIRLKYLGTPWYMPIFSTLGVALMVSSLWRRRGLLRGLVLIPFLLLSGLEWFFVTAATRTPAYNGPAHPGVKTPAFSATLADGTPFTRADLEKGDSTVLVFYRGRW